MRNLDKRLVEVEAILNKLSDKNKNKIPKQLWDFIKDNKDNNYIYRLNKREDIHIDTICILTYVNMEYLMNNAEQKKMKEILEIDQKYKFYKITK